MATFDEALLAATKQLDERGQLLNFELSRLVDRDEDLLREIRETLIFQGIAEDRFGVGLVRVDNSRSEGFQPPILVEQVDGGLEAYPTDDAAVESQPNDEITFQAIEETADESWWLMSSGVRRGPFSLTTMQLMLHRGEIGVFDVVRAGERGAWQRPADVDCLKDHHESPNRGSTTNESKPLPLRTTDEDNPKTEFVQTANAVKPGNNTPAKSTPVAARPAKRSRIRDDCDNEYFLWEAGTPVGPVSRSELRTRVKSGRINTDEMVQVGEDGDWQPVSRALGMPRAPLNIPRIRDVSSQIALEIPAARQSSPAITTNRFSSTVGKTTSASQSPTRNSAETRTSQARSAKSSTEKSPSSISGIWHQAAGVVGGSRRLAILIVLSSATLTTVWYLRQPPSSQKICAEVQSSYEKLVKLRGNAAGAKGGGMLPNQLAEEATRIRVFRDVLKKRASAARRGDQELLWACEYGLLPLLEHPNSDEFDEIYSGHMSRAQLEISPSSAGAGAGKPGH